MSSDDPTHDAAVKRYVYPFTYCIYYSNFVCAVISDQSDEEGSVADEEDVFTSKYVSVSLMLCLQVR